MLSVSSVDSEARREERMWTVRHWTNALQGPSLLPWVVLKAISAFWNRWKQLLGQADSLWCHRHGMLQLTEWRGRGWGLESFVNSDHCWDLPWTGTTHPYCLSTIPWQVTFPCCLWCLIGPLKATKSSWACACNNSFPAGSWRAVRTWCFKACLLICSEPQTPTSPTLLRLSLFAFWSQGLFWLSYFLHQLREIFEKKKWGLNAEFLLLFGEHSVTF